MIETQNTRQSARTTKPELWAALAVSAALLLLPLIFHLDGKPHADWQQFLGRFHPLAVHIPIGLILLVPLLEIAGTRRPALRETAGFVLNLAALAGLGTLTLGYLLAYGAGDTGAIVTRHLWGGIALSILLLACVLTRPRWASGADTRRYPAAQVCVLIALLFTAHQGGSLTHGDRYLTEYMPAPMRQFVALGATAPSSASFYVQRVHPILDANCVSCHGASKTEGGLRLDTYDGILKGGKDGSSIVPRDPTKSLLHTRVTLPAGDKHLMPAEGRPPLRPDDIAILRAWILDGASSTATNVAGITAPTPTNEPPAQPVADYSALNNDIAQLQQAQGAKLLPLSARPSDGLILNTVDAPATFTDAQLAQFIKFAPYIVEANLARTAVTDAGFDTLAKFTRLRALHLEGTAVTGSGASKLAPLTQLTYLNLSDTRVTAAATPSIKSLPHLRHVYLFNTPGEPAPAAEPEPKTSPTPAAKSTP